MTENNNETCPKTMEHFEQRFNALKSGYASLNVVNDDVLDKARTAGKEFHNLMQPVFEKIESSPSTNTGTSTIPTSSDAPPAAAARPLDLVSSSSTSSMPSLEQVISRANTAGLVDNSQPSEADKIQEIYNKALSELKREDWVDKATPEKISAALSNTYDAFIALSKSFGNTAEAARLKTEKDNAVKNLTSIINSKIKQLDMNQPWSEDKKDIEKLKDIKNILSSGGPKFITGSLSSAVGKVASQAASGLKGAKRWAAAVAERATRKNRGGGKNKTMRNRRHKKQKTNRRKINKRITNKRN